MMPRRFIVIHEKDNVLTALTPLDPSTSLSVQGTGGKKSVLVKEPIPFGHKCALRMIRKGEEIIKYGETIGEAARDIHPGEHVHTHNLLSLRGKRRGD